MKTLTNVIVNNFLQDAIIESFMKASRDEDGKIIWANEKDGIAKCHGDARDVTILVKDTDDSRKITAIEISTVSIKRLYETIMGIEKQESEEFIDEWKRL